MAEELSTLEILQGSFTFVFVIISIVLGLTIMSKYLKFKRRELLLVGFTWIALSSVYWPDAITFITVLVSGEWVRSDIYYLLANILVAPVHISWMLAMTDFMWKKRQNLLMIIISIEAIVFETFLLTIWIIDYNLVGARQSAFVVLWNPVVDLYLIVSIILFLVTGAFFARQSLKSENAEIKWKGKFILTAFILFSIGTMLDVITVNPTEITIVLARTFVISAAFAFYVGFTMPKWLKTLLIK
ncbi:MAG: hypothetical protein EU535_08345 [Promethearchaeota archaeon]|nr:MAG: hypothetical protein EU535_08345 [Candidatus Lokiarchaeota archaeon]